MDALKLRSPEDTLIPSELQASSRKYHPSEEGVVMLAPSVAQLRLGQGWPASPGNVTNSTTQRKTLSSSSRESRGG